MHDALTPSWQRVTEGEHRWPVALVVLFVICLQFLLPTDLVVSPQWLMPAIELVILAAICLASPTRIKNNPRSLRTAGLLLCAMLSIGNAAQAIRLIMGIVTGTNDFDAAELLLSGAGIWLTNIVVYALWYWELDRGGPAARANGSREHADFVFPQMRNNTQPVRKDWFPTFFDYLYLAFTNATSFSPADTTPMTRWAKMLMMSQAFISLVIATVVIARSIGILQ